MTAPLLPGVADRVVVVTGAASGIGLATARLFSAAGAHPVMTDWNEDRLHRAADGVPGAFPIRLDVSSEADVAEMTRAVFTRMGRIDILFNNAGIGPSAQGKYAMNDLTEGSEENWDAVVAVNLRGVALCCKHVLPSMVEREGGVIINNASINAIVGFPGSDAYTAAKGGVVALTRALAVRWGRHGIRINCICPGPVDTPMTGGPNRLGDPVRRAQEAQRIPLGRIANSCDIAGVVLLLASELASFVHGAIIPVDGGWTASAGPV